MAPVREFSEEIALEAADSHSSLNFYLNEINRWPVLTKKEERKLTTITSRSIRAENLWRSLEEGRYQRNEIRWQEKAKRLIVRTLSPEAFGEEKEAQKILVEHNLLLVVDIVREKFWSPELPVTISMLDLIQSGNKGLILAASRYWKRQFKFSTFATPWITQSIFRDWAKVGRTIRWPLHIIPLARRVQSAQNKLRKELGREPSAKEITDRVNQGGKKISLKSVNSLLHVIHRRFISLDAPPRKGEDWLTPLRALPDGESTETTALKNQLAREIQTMLKESGLTEKQRAIINQRFGLNGTNSQSLREVGRHLQISPEGVRLIQKEALEKLRSIAAKRFGSSNGVQTEIKV